MDNAHLQKHPFFEWRYICDKSGLTYPWYTEDCLKWLRTRDFSKSRVFEFGAGLSTFWWRYNSLRGTLVSVEDDYEWAHKVGACYAPTKEAYLKLLFETAQKYGNYDVIIIDGSHRDDCTEIALQCIKKGGFIIIDNFHQASADLPIEAWPKTNDLLAHYPQIVFHQTGHDDWKTSVWQIVK